MVWRCDDCLIEKVTATAVAAPKCPNCGGTMGKLLAALLSKGRLSSPFPPPIKFAKRCLRSQATKLFLEERDPGPFSSLGLIMMVFLSKPVTFNLMSWKPKTVCVS